MSPMIGERFEVIGHRGNTLAVEWLEQDAVRFTSAGEVVLTGEQAKALRDWLDDGEARLLRKELATVREDVRPLLEHLRGAWWLEAAAAYGRLEEGTS